MAISTVLIAGASIISGTAVWTAGSRATIGVLCFSGEAQDAKTSKVAAPLHVIFIMPYHTQFKGLSQKK